MSTDTETKQTGLVNQDFDAEAKALIKNTLLPGCTDAQLQLFCMVCKRTNLDPFQHQITAFIQEDKYGNKKLVFVTTIDGYRIIAGRSNEYDGQEPPMWCGTDGVWKDIWLEDKPPYAAKVTVYRKDCKMPFTGIAKFSSFAKWYKAKDGTMCLKDTWKTMPDHMIAKVAEAHALRKGFPNDLSGLYTFDEIDVDEEKAKGKGVKEYKEAEVIPPAPKNDPKNDQKQAQDAQKPAEAPKPQPKQPLALENEIKTFLGILEFNGIPKEFAVEVLAEGELVKRGSKFEDIPEHLMKKMVSQKGTDKIIQMYEAKQKEGVQV